MTRPAPRMLRRLSGVVALVVAITATTASAQGAFRVSHTVDRTSSTQTVLSGRVFNDGRADAVDVYVTAEALDVSGKVVASGVAYVAGVPAGSSSTFAMKVPTVRNAATYRVIVTSFRFGFAVQS